MRRIANGPGPVVAGLVVVAMSGAGHAQTLDFGSCVRVEDARERLACYDTAAGRRATPAPAVTAAPTARTPPAPVPTAPAAAAATGPSAAAVPAAAAAAPSALTPEEAFGASSKKLDSAAAGGIERIEAKVVAVRQRGGAGEFVLTLENGQVWQQTEYSRDPQIEAGDTIVIRKAALGSFLMSLASGSRAVRVRRIS